MIEMKNMYSYEKDLINKGIEYIAGVDEAGRGPLAGDLVVASVILPKNIKLEGVDDSKKLTDKKRRDVFEEIKKVAIAYSIVFISVEEVDKYNIYAATQIGMKRCIDELSIKPEYVLIDAMPLDLEIDNTSIIKGDSLSLSIAAASILAKVTRDDYMNEMDKKYPEYGFSSHKGYGTKKHLEALSLYGVTPIHRTTYAPVKKQLEKQLELNLY